MDDTRGQIKSELATGQLRSYIDKNIKDPHPFLATIRARCMEHKWNFMLTTRDQAAFLHTQARSMSACKILELGSFYGHSTLAMAAALPTGGKLITIEHNPKFADVTRKHMTEAGVGNLVDVITGEAPLTLPGIERDHAPHSFDLIFVDADKRHFEFYWDAAMRLTRPGGVIIFDNALARGEILDESPDAAGHIAAVRNFNARVLNDNRVFSYIATIADGMLVAISLPQ
jgi:predicted O-methyltransferase YrrM